MRADGDKLCLALSLGFECGIAKPAISLHLPLSLPHFYVPLDVCVNYFTFFVGITVQ